MPENPERLLTWRIYMDDGSAFERQDSCEIIRADSAKKALSDWLLSHQGTWKLPEGQRFAVVSLGGELFIFKITYPVPSYELVPA